MCRAKHTTSAVLTTAAWLWQETAIHPPLFGFLGLLYERLQVWPACLALLLPAEHKAVNMLLLL
jgi:hypothetical protein